MLQKSLCCCAYVLQHAYNWGVKCVAAQEYKLAIPSFDAAYTLFSILPSKYGSMDYGMHANLSLLLLGECKVEVAWLSNKNEQAIMGQEMKCIAELVNRSFVQTGTGKEFKTRLLVFC